MLSASQSCNKGCWFDAKNCVALVKMQASLVDTQKKIQINETAEKKQKKKKTEFWLMGHLRRKEKNDKKNKTKP